MKKLLSLLAATVGIGFALNAAPPKLMLLPDKTWCNEKGYVDVNERGGRTVVKERYDRAFLDQSLKNVETEFKSLMSSLSFPVVSYDEATSNDEDEDAIEEMYESSESGSGIESAGFEQLIAAKGNAPDIYIKVGWSTEKAGLRKALVYRVDAVDAYSSKSVATVTGTTQPVAASTSDALLLMEGLRDKMDEFTSKLQSHFDDVQQNGREISLRVTQIANGSGAKFSDVYGDKKLTQIITDWIADNTVNHQYTEKQATRNRLSYDQVRVALLDEYGRPQQARHWVDKLAAYLQSNYGIASENNSSGLGSGRLMIGEN